jgi:hypothetical protein
MYIAEMFMYGQHQTYVGVNGVVSCMGVFAVYNQRMFAIHVPSGIDTSKTGCHVFTKYFHDKNPGYDGGAKLYAFTKFNKRGQHVEEEVRQWRAALDADEATLFQITADDDSAAAIICERIPGGNDVKLWYKNNNDVAWGTGLGAQRDGKYHGDQNATDDSRYSTNPPTTHGGWAPFDSGNALIISVSLFPDLSWMSLSPKKSKTCSIL